MTENNPILSIRDLSVRFSLRDTAEKMRQVYARYPEISVIDCYPFLPHDFSLFSDPHFAIHPNSAGHDLYALRLLEALGPILGAPAPRRDAERAADVLQKV